MSTDDVRSEEAATEEKPQEKAPETQAEQKAGKPDFAKYDPRKSIYEKSDAIRFPKPPEPEQEEETPAEEAKPEEADAPKEDAETAEAEGEKEAEGEQEPAKETPREARKRENLEAKEKRLSAWEQKLRQQFTEAEEPPKPKVQDPAVTPLRQMSEDQVESRYNELAIESQYRANQFLRQVDAARAAAQVASEQERVEADFRDFREAYPDVNADDWVRMNDDKFYGKYPDIMRAMERGNHYAAFVSAKAHLDEEKRNAQHQTAKAREAALRARDELKKKGAVLRVQTKAETKPTEKEEPPKSKEQMQREYFEQIRSQRQGSMKIPTTLGAPRK